MAIEKKNIIEEKCMNFSVEVVNLMKQIQKVRHEYKMSDQMMRAGTAVGANYGETMFAESDTDFVHKIRVALKENHEFLYWLELLYKTEYIDKIAFDSLNDKAVELRKILTSSVNTVLRRIESQKRS